MLEGSLKFQGAEMTKERKKTERERERTRTSAKASVTMP